MSLPVNLEEALKNAMTNPSAPQPPNPIMAELNFLRLLTTWLLYERSQETELRAAFEGLATERHQKFHSEDKPLVDCRNLVCVNARMILESQRKPELIITNACAAKIKDYGVMLQPLPQGTLVSLRQKPTANSSPIVVPSAAERSAILR